MSTKAQTSSAILFNKLVGDTYVDGSLQRSSGTQVTGPEAIQGGSQADLCNVASAGSIGVYIAKSFFSEHIPYTGSPGFYVFNTHFMQEMRRQMSGDSDFSRFSPDEQALYNAYVSYVNDTRYDSKYTLVVPELDNWLVDEVQNLTHSTTTRRYADDHQWMKINEREIV